MPGESTTEFIERSGFKYCLLALMRSIGANQVIVSLYLICLLM